MEVSCLQSCLMIPPKAFLFTLTKIGLSSRGRGFYILRMFYKRNMVKHSALLGLQAQVTVFPFLGCSNSKGWRSFLFPFNLILPRLVLWLFSFFYVLFLFYAFACMVIMNFTDKLVVLNRFYFPKTTKLN